jgi:hypothetical protein
LISAKTPTSWKPQRRSGRGSWPSANVLRLGAGCPTASHGNSRKQDSFASFYRRHTAASISPRWRRRRSSRSSRARTPQSRGASGTGTPTGRRSGGRRRLPPQSLPIRIRFSRTAPAPVDERWSSRVVIGLAGAGRWLAAASSAPGSSSCASSMKTVSRDSRRQVRRNSGSCFAPPPTATSWIRGPSPDCGAPAATMS